MNMKKQDIIVVLSVKPNGNVTAYSAKIGPRGAVKRDRWGIALGPWSEALRGWNVPDDVEIRVQAAEPYTGIDFAQDGANFLMGN
jgi:hypothetical protein